MNIHSVIREKLKNGSISLNDAIKMAKNENLPQVFIDELKNIQTTMVDMLDDIDEEYDEDYEEDYEEEEEEDEEDYYKEEYDEEDYDDEYEDYDEEDS